MRCGALILAALLLVAVPADAQTTVLPMATRAAGTYAFTQVTVPTGTLGVSMQMDISQATDPLPQLDGLVEGSLDGGTTWMAVGGFSRPAGPKTITSGGATIATLGARFAGGPFWSASTNANRRVRGAATLGGSMRFAMTVQLL